MKKILLFLAALLAVLSLILTASASTSDENPSSTDQDMLAAFFEKVTDGMTEKEMQALLFEIIAKKEPTPQAGEIVSGYYFHSLGFFFPIPEGYRVLEDTLGATVHLIGPAEDGGITPSIHVLALDAPQLDFEMLTQTKTDAFFGAVFSNYQFVSLDHYKYNGVMAHEFVCLHGASDDGMMIQNTLCFNKGDKAYILTMTTLAEEATLEYALLAYDVVLSGFTVPEDMEDAGEGNG